ncbi:MAG: hypothetical protein JWL81_3014 [Verrucomicrobiales bacterium]|nr:hypothetical protein [Verrucomicrobiales bacterium]
MIHIGRDGVQQGPYTQEQVNAMLAGGQLRATDQAWREGLPGWVPLSQLQGVILPGSGAAASVSAGAGYASPAVVESAPAAGVYAAPRSALTPGATMAGQVSAATVLALKQTRPWVLLLAILGLIVVGLMLLGGMGMLAAGAFAKSAAPSVGPGGSGAMPTALFAGMGVGYLVFAFLYLYPIIKLFKYSSAISRLSATGSVRELEVALQEQKSFWKFIGIVTLVVMVLYAIGIILFFVAGAGMMSAGGGLSSPPFSTPPTSTTP